MLNSVPLNDDRISQRQIMVRKVEAKVLASDMGVGICEVTGEGFGTGLAGLDTAAPRSGSFFTSFREVAGVPDASGVPAKNCSHDGFDRSALKSLQIDGHIRHENKLTSAPPIINRQMIDPSCLTDAKMNNPVIIIASSDRVPLRGVAAAV